MSDTIRAIGFENLRRRLPAGTPVYLFGSRARGDAAWHANYDLWIDADIPAPAVAEILEAIDESFVPFKIDLVATPRLQGRFGERVRAEAIRWI